MYFQWCFTVDNFGNRTFCVDEAASELSALGLTVETLATFSQPISWNKSVLLKCKNYEKQIVSGRIYNRVVIPVNSSTAR